MLHTAVTDCLI